ncbi:MAG: aminomethyl transferase family protein [Proteobacteria bacterium]|nr:aminomethyl transferase family protein [Pseudomonadota bacterium]
MLRKSIFFDFLNRRDEPGFERFMAASTEDEHYINWNQFALPHDYGDAESEYHAIRNSCAMFDVSPIRKISVRGSGAGAFFDRLMTRPVSDVAAMRATYTVFCNEDGSLKDDAILYKYADDDYLLMPSDVDHSPYFESLCRRFELGNVVFTECTDSWAGIAVQGPKSASALLHMGVDRIHQLKPFEVRDYELAGGNMRISRIGFTADLGYECWFEPGLADAFKQNIQFARSAMNIELPGYGLSALQTCRLEGGFIVAGWDCATELEPQPGFERSPYELGLGWLVNLDAAPFVGRDALLEQKKNGCQFTLRSFEIDGTGPPDDGAELTIGAGNHDALVGTVNSSSWSWGMNKIIGNASIKSEHAGLENAWVTIDGKQFAVTLSHGPLISLERRNQVPAPLLAR